MGLGSRWPPPLDSRDYMLAAYSAAYRRLPLTVAFATCFLKGSAADCVTQLVTRRTTPAPADDAARWDLDWSRNLAFATWSGAYLGSWQHVLFNVLYGTFDRRFRSSKALAAGAKVVFDNFVHLPFLYFPLYYVSQPVLRGEASRDGGTSMQEAMQEGWANYKKHGYETVVSGLSLWIPVSTVNFYLVPPPLRVGFMAVVSFGWLTVLSFISNNDDGDEEDGMATATRADCCCPDPNCCSRQRRTQRRGSM